MTTTKYVAVALLLQIAALPVLDAGQLHASNVGVDVNIRLGAEPRPVIVTQPAYQPEPYYEEEEVDFVYPEELGFYVAVGVPYDLFYLNNLYFIYRDGQWLRSRSSRGGWTAVRYRELPPVLRRHRIERVREYRTREYVVYQRDRDHYRGRHRSDKGRWKEARHEEKRHQKARDRDEKRYEKERHRDDRGFEKDRRHDDRRGEKEHRGGRD